jgi:FixJ family two-component response regulator
LPTGLPKCLIVDLQIACHERFGASHLAGNGFHNPTIMITAHGDTALNEHDKAGVATFFLKPLQVSSLLAAVDKAFGVPGTRG